MALKSFNKSHQENLGVEKNLQRTFKEQLQSLRRNNDTKPSS